MDEPKPYKFGRAAIQSPALLTSLDRLGERIGRELRGLIEPLGGVRPSVTPRPAQRVTFAEWSAGLPGFTSLGLYRLHPIKGIVTLRIDSRLVSTLVDRFYGGRGALPESAGREFRPAETRLAERLADQTVVAMVGCWAETAALDAILVGRANAVTQGEIASPDTDMIVQGFEIGLGGAESWTVEIVYPGEGLVGIEGLGASRAPADDLPIDIEWQERLMRSMDDVRLPARTVIASPNLKMTELMALQPGDVIDIHVARHLPLIVGERVVAHGTLGEQDGRAAFMVERLA